MYFVKVVEIKSLTGASEQLNVAQPALGLQIKYLEEELGVALLVRHSRGVHATPAGEFLYRRAVSLLQAMKETRQDVMNFANNASEMIRLGLTPSFMQLVGPDLPIEAREIMPGVFLSLVEELSYNLITSLEGDKLDAAFVYAGINRPSMPLTALLEEDLLFVSSPDVDSSTDPISFAEVARRELVLPGKMDVVRGLMDDTAARVSVPLNVLYETQSIQATRNIIFKGLAGGIVPYGSVKTEIDQGSMVARRIIKPAVTRTLYLARAPRYVPFSHDDELKAFLERCLARLREELGDLSRPLGDI